MAFLKRSAVLGLSGFVFLLVISTRRNLLGNIERLHDRHFSVSEVCESEFFRWSTESAFLPWNQSFDHDTSQDLCQTFPTHILHDIQPVLKTGHDLLHARVAPQLQSVSACLGEHLLIFSDSAEEFRGHEIIDIISDLRNSFVQGNEQLRDYILRKELTSDGTAQRTNATQSIGWGADKFKFLPQVSRAWRIWPGKKWYVFYEDDTYVVWDNMFRLLANFDPDKPWYFGSPSPGAKATWMANGGPGLVISREAMRRLVQDDYDNNGAFVGSALSQRWEDQMTKDCCGDSVLGLALHDDAHTNLSGLWPMFQPHPLHGIPFSDEYWCQPVITMHKTSAEDMIGLRRWEENKRKASRPLLFADLIEYLNLTGTPVRQDWTNSEWDGYPAPLGSLAHTSFEACGLACKDDQDCFQWTYHLRSCEFVRSFRLGQAKSADVEDWRSDEEGAFQWTDEDTRFTAGWDVDSIKRWMHVGGRECAEVQWVRPSLVRIF